jgi:hypothetical protein
VKHERTCIKFSPDVSHTFIFDDAPSYYLLGCIIQFEVVSKLTYQHCSVTSSSYWYVSECRCSHGPDKLFITYFIRSFTTKFTASSTQELLCEYVPPLRVSKRFSTPRLRVDGMIHPCMIHCSGRTIHIYLRHQPHFCDVVLDPG